MSLVEVTDLTVSYRNGRTPIRSIHMTVEEGQSVAITGVSGRGKSTLLYAVAGLIAPSGGSVRLAGTDLATCTESQRARLRADRVGFVFQDAALDGTRTVIDNVTEVALFRSERRATLADHGRQLLTSVGLGELADSKPGQLSGGQAQRVGLARALVGSPSIVLADEPTGNLDPASADMVLRVLLDYVGAFQACLLVATHDPTVRDACSRSLAL